MQTTTTTFNNLSQADLRHLSWKLMISFNKEFDENIDFFTLNQSVLDGTDLLVTFDNDVIQEWDKYNYVDYSNRVIDIEWSSQFDMPDSVSLAMADIVLDNHDGFFTTGHGSEIDGFILPRRPIRLYAGFNGNIIPVFVGLTEKLPKLDEKSGTATFHCIDFLDSLFNRSLDQSIMYVNKRTDEILSSLLQSIGLLSNQFQLDTAINTIPFAYFEKGSKFGDAAKKLMEAELGRLYMDELGIIRFKNRLNFSTTSIYTFNNSNTIERIRSDYNDIINVVEIKAKPREVQEKQPIFQSSSTIEIPSGSSVDIWSDFSNPVTSVDEPSNGIASNTSYYIVRISDSQTANQVSSGVLTDSFSIFATSSKVTISNSNLFPVYITELELWGTPAKIIGGDDNEIYIREQDDDSVSKYDEHPKSIENDFIQSETEATAIASIILFRNSEYGTTYNIEVKGSPAFQLADAITINDGINSDIYIISSQENQIANGKYTQRIRAISIKELSFFTLNQSILDGIDVLTF